MRRGLILGKRLRGIFAKNFEISALRYRFSAGGRKVSEPGHNDGKITEIYCCTQLHEFVGNME